MSLSETLYTFRVPHPQVLERGRAQDSTLEVYRNGALVAPTAETSSYTLYDPNGNVVVELTVTVPASIATVSFDAGDLPSTLAFGEGYREEWVVALPDYTKTVRREAAVARSALYPVVAGVDVDFEYPDASRYWSGAQTQTYIDEAWNRILARLRREGVICYLVMSVDAFRDAHRELANALRCKAEHMKAPGSERWMQLYELHMQAYTNAWPRLNYVLDANQDGVADDTNRQGAGTVVHLNPAPARRLARSGRW